MQQRMHELVVSFGSWLIQRLESVIAWGSKVGNPAFFDPAEHPEFAWTRGLEARWTVIRDELMTILEYQELLPSFHDISKDQRRISDDRWKTYFFCAYGINAEGNRARCPATSRIIDAIPGMKTAFFSILAPGKHIPAHRGPFKGMIRYHLGLMVPEPRGRCRIRVGTEMRHWEEGKGLMFDDTYEHEVRNDTPGTRVVLFLDVVRPAAVPREPAQLAGAPDDCALALHPGRRRELSRLGEEAGPGRHHPKAEGACLIGRRGRRRGMGR